MHLLLAKLFVLDKFGQLKVIQFFALEELSQQHLGQMSLMLQHQTLSADCLKGLFLPSSCLKMA